MALLTSRWDLRGIILDIGNQSSRLCSYQIYRSSGNAELWVSPQAKNSFVGTPPTLGLFAGAATTPVQAQAIPKSLE